ncbi:MAG TPA: 5-methyltetrahydropteroyltriglutamate--homocysteine S-methyltransferase [Gemmatimonadaceae bacterium]|nr:5-methyltetrahydropteroyltriglutamate--homocysteine S-methyltransferase [Gemmatimonadaceae bacterium]
MATRSAVAAANLGFPRIGRGRELKSALERFWAGKSSAGELESTALGLRERHWQLQAAAKIGIVPSNDFSLYDHVLDAAALVGAVPERFRAERARGELATCFAMARGTPGAPAMEMTKWFDTNYHYIVPELDAPEALHLASDKPLREYREARALGIETRPVLLGPVSFVLLSRTAGNAESRARLAERVADVYAELIDRLAGAGAEWIQLDEPCLGLDLADQDRWIFPRAYDRVSGHARLAVATYFSDLRENLPLAMRLPIDALHLDLVRAPGQLARALDLAPSRMTLSLGVVNGRGVWRTDLGRALATVRDAVDRLGASRVQVAPSCSLLHVPIDRDIETSLPAALRERLAFATQKLDEVALLARAATDDNPMELLEHAAARRQQTSALPHDAPLTGARVLHRAEPIDRGMLVREAAFAERRRVQRERVPLPPLPTTTIGSLPQTAEVRRMRAALRRGHVTNREYEAFMRREIERGIRFQEEVGLDVLVHGEFERSDMVEYFAEQLEGFAFTEHGWVQSYGSRCVKPPLLHGDVSRPHPLTVAWSRYAQSLTTRPVKGMLTGPVTMLQWSFVRDDVAPALVATQVALALRDEVADLERAGIHVIQVDEPALREALPLRRDERAEYLQWATDAFRLATGGAHAETQIHTHMCYAEFGEILNAVVRMDADVLSLEAARSRTAATGVLEAQSYGRALGPGVYDVHSPRVPSVDEFAEHIRRALEIAGPEQVWVNPDCGLKTRSWSEVRAALANMVEAARVVRAELAAEGPPLVERRGTAA